MDAAPAGVDQHRGEGRHGDLPDQPREDEQDGGHPQSAPDPGPPRSRASGDVECGLPDRASDGLTAEQSRRCVGEALGGEVTPGGGGRPVGIRNRFCDTGALHQDQGGHRQRSADQREVEGARVRKLRERQSLGDLTVVLDQRHTSDTQQQDSHRRDCERDQRADRSDPGPAEDHQCQQGGAARDGGGRLDVFEVGEHEEGLGGGDAAFGGDTEEIRAAGRAPC